MRHELRRVPLQRLLTRYIILTQVKNMVQTGYYIAPAALVGSYKLSYPLFEDYFYKTINPERMAKGNVDNLGMPFHYFIEQVLNDYQISVCQPEYSYSYFLQDLVSARIIPEKYKMSIVVAIAEDFTLELPDKRIWEQLAQKLLVPLTLRYGLDNYKIMYIDELINYDTLEKKKEENNLTYKIEQAKFFSKEDMLMEFRNFMKVRKF